MTSRQPAISLSRRAVIQGAAAACAVPALADAKWPLAKVDKRAAAEAKRIGTGGKALRVLLPNGSQGNVLPVLAAFRDMSGIQVEHQVAPVDDINTMMLLQAAQKKTGFDVALPATFGVSELAEANAILDLTKMADRYLPTAFDDDAFFQLGDTYRGARYGFQTDGDVYLLFALDWLTNGEHQAAYKAKFGQELKWPTTWEELDRQMRYFHRPDRGEYGGALFRTPGYVLWEWWLRFHSKGRLPVDADFNPQLASEEGVEALEELVRATDFLHPSVRTAGLFENWKVFKEAKCVYNLGWGGTQKSLNASASPVRNRLLHGATPGIRGATGPASAMAYFNWGWSYTVSKSSPSPEVSFLLAMFATSPTQSLVAVRDRDGYFDPFRREHYNDEKVVTAYGKPFLDAHQAAHRVTIPDFYVSAQGEFFSALRDGLVAALEGQRTAKQALDRVSSDWSRIARRTGRRNLCRQWKFVRASYPRAHRKRLR